MDAFEVAACGLMQTTEDGVFRRVNRTFCTWVGHPADALVGKRRLHDLLTMGGRIFHQTHWSPLLRMQGSLSEVKLELQHADGSTIPMVLNALRRDDEGTCVHELAAFIARDRDRYERELVTARKRLEILVDEAKDRALFAEQMIGIVSHDLRNPLAAVMMGTAMLAGSALPDTLQRVVGRINRSAERMNGLISDLLDFTQARVGAGLSVAPVEVSLHELVAEAIDELRLANPGRALVHVRSGPSTCVVDGNRVVQLLGNLVANALAYGATDAPITVTSSVAPAGASLAVHNTGPAIPAAIRDSLFQPMTRGDRTGKAHSVGLGLFIVREIARAHAGTATVTSSEDAGTTFTATFPRR